MLAVLGGARMHQQDFVLFLAVVLALAVGIVAVFVATGVAHAPPAREEERPGRD